MLFVAEILAKTLREKRAEGKVCSREKGMPNTL
jgi:hypothetical protein